jgi:hypothetical protein
MFQCAHCRYQFSVTAGTSLQDTRLPVSVWIHAAELLCRDRDITAREIETALGVTYKTASSLRRRLRSALPARGARLELLLRRLLRMTLVRRRTVRGDGLEDDVEKMREKQATHTRS